MEIDYIALFVEDVPRSVAFYRDRLGFTFTKPIAASGTEGRSGHLRIGIYDRTWLPKLLGDRQDGFPPGYGMLLSMTVDDLDATYTDLLDHGVEILMPPQPMDWGQRLLFLRDPDGNLLEIVQSDIEGDR